MTTGLIIVIFNKQLFIQLLTSLERHLGEYWSIVLPLLELKLVFELCKQNILIKQ